MSGEFGVVEFEDYVPPKISAPKRIMPVEYTLAVFAALGLIWAVVSGLAHFGVLGLTTFQLLMAGALWSWALAVAIWVLSRKYSKPVDN